MSIEYKSPISMPLLALRGMVIFPKSSVTFEVARKKSIAALRAAFNSGGLIFLVTQHNATETDPTPDKLYDVGCIGRVKQILHLPGGNNYRAVVEGIVRAKSVSVTATEPYFVANVAEMIEFCPKMSEVKKEALLRTARATFEDYAKTANKIPPDVIMSIVANKDLGRLSPGTLKILPYPIMKVDCLSHIKDQIPFVHDIYAALMRYFFQLFLLACGISV